MSVELQKKYELVNDYDVVVCGGGPAGIAAAVSSAKMGAKTLVLEMGGCLGGLWTRGLLTWVLDVANKTGFMKEVVDTLVNKGEGQIIEYGDKFSADTEEMKLLFEEMCQKSGVTVLYHTFITGVVKEDRTIKYITTESKSGSICFGAKVFIDATGDGDIGYFAGCVYDVGNDEGETQPMSLIGQVMGVKPEDMAPFDDRISKGRKKALREQLEKAGVNPSYKSTLLAGLCDEKERYALMTNHEYGYKFNDAFGISKATIHGRKEVAEHVNGLKALGGLWKDIKLISTADYIGVREGRRIKGLYEVTEHDMVAGAQHEDAVCTVAFGVDVHNLKPDSEQTDRETYKREHKPYQIPFRALIAKDVDNLLLSGRCISGDFIAHSSYRVGGDAATIGQGAGAAAAYCAKNNILPKDIKNIKEILKEVE